MGLHFFSIGVIGCFVLVFHHGFEAGQHIGFRTVQFIFGEPMLEYTFVLL